MGFHYCVCQAAEGSVCCEFCAGGLGGDCVWGDDQVWIFLEEGAVRGFGAFGEIDGQGAPFLTEGVGGRGGFVAVKVCPDILGEVVIYCENVDRGADFVIESAGVVDGGDVHWAAVGGGRLIEGDLGAGLALEGAV